MKRIKAKHIIEILIHLAFWIGLYYTLNSVTGSTIQMEVNNTGKDEIVQKFQVSAISRYSWLTLVFMALLFYGNIFVIFKAAVHFRTMLGGIAGTITWFALTFSANYILVGSRFNVPVPFPPTLHGFGTHKEGANIVLHGKAAFFATGTPFHAHFNVLLIFLVVLGLSIAYFFLKEWARAEKVRSKLAAVQLDTEIKFLKSQVNPHFLFNTLNNLFSMAQKKGNDDLAEGISKLSGMMRYMIYESNEEKAPLKKEIEYLEDCILLNKLRYADGEAVVSFDHPPSVEGVFIAPMLFIPFVENAFKHGVAIGKRSRIGIALSVSDNELIFTCVNDDHKHVKKMDDENGGIGLDNVKRRLDLVYPDKHELEITNSDNQYRVELKINLK